MKSLIIFMTAIVTGGMLQAQTFNEHESIREQLKKGTAPELKFSPVTSVKPVKEDVSEIQKKESLVTQIRKGTAKGMRFQTGGSAARTITPATQKTTKQGPLSSELERPKEQPKVAKPPVIPSQEEKSKS
jgi:hypothetical protein